MSQPPPDGLQLRRAMPARMLPSLVAAMAFLAALAFAGAVGAHLLACRWSAGAGAIVTVQVPDPALPGAGGASRIDAVAAQLARTPGVAGTHRLHETELRRLLQPWLGTGGDLGLPLPAVVQLRLGADAPPSAALAGRLAAAAPGTIVEDSAPWRGRLLALTASLQACAALALLTVAVVAGCVVALATRAGIAQLRHAIELVHGLGAGDGYIAGVFARRAGLLALVGGAAGALLALPLLGGLSHLAAPFVAPTGPGVPDAGGEPLLGAMLPSWMQPSWMKPSWMKPGRLSWPLLLSLPTLPLAGGLIGWLTAQATVRVWLRRLP